MRDSHAFAQLIARVGRHPAPRRLLRYAVSAAVVAYFVAVTSLIGLRYLVLPQVEQYRGDIESALSAAIGLPVDIAHIEASWHGLRPNLALLGFAVRDSAGRAALSFDKVDAELGWSSLWHWDLRLERLEIAAPALAVRRDAGGRIFVAGLQVDRESQESRFSDWLLEQHNIVVRGATVTWTDEQRGAPPLVLAQLNFHLRNDGGRHRFGLNADPPGEKSTRLDLRGDFRDDADTDAVSPSWTGEAYAEIDYVDLALWRQWLDYPLEMPSGSGGLRLWLGVERQQLTRLTADIALADVQARLAPELPLLQLRRMSGRLGAERRPGAFAASAAKLTLTTADGISLAPTDFRLDWSAATPAQAARGKFSANALDLDALSRLAAYLPVDEAVRQRLAAAAAHGKLSNLTLNWSLAAESLAGFSLRADFAGLGMAAQGAVPGFAGLSGSVEGDDQGGSLKLASREASLELPAVFADPHLSLATLNAQVKWKQGKDGLTVRLEGCSFDNRDAAGTAAGTYLWRAGEPGVIDLTARLTRGEGAAVWRYMPLSVNKQVRDWLHASILGGSASEANLRLQGDLRRFPFAQGGGVFEVRGKFHAARLRYAEAWPGIDDISGELAFIGRRMLISASRGKIFDVGLSEVTAQIDDLESSDEILLVKGKARGPSPGFLRFVEASPVGEWIEHVTEEMGASGDGHLDLKLTLPLQRLDKTQVNGVFEVAGNRLVAAPGMPPLTELGGRLEFTADTLKAERVHAHFLGLPVAAELRSRADGGVQLNAEGGASVAALRRSFDLPVLEHLSGNSSWRLAARLRGKNADLVIDSRLVGISSSLPEPFNKSATDALPLRYERRLLTEPVRRGAKAKPVLREQIDLNLGTVAAARLLRRVDPIRSEKTAERGAVAIGTPLQLPDKGLLLSVRAKKLDIDFWRGLFAGGTASGLPVTQVELKANELRAFGRSVSELALSASAREGGWHALLKSREASGELDWRSSGAGRLSGHLHDLTLNNAATTAAGSSYSPDELPGIDLEVDRFLLGDKLLGHLKLSADNRKALWEAKLDIDNEDGKLNGSGSWKSEQGRATTQLQFLLSAKSVEKMLQRVGYPDAVRRGQATLEGRLSWNGSPLALDYPTLEGSLAVLAASGQFNKLEPGAGRLLGILSLQSLPRRITLDFRDVFSEGFAFDNIAGQIDVRNGIMTSKDLRIQGPAAKITMSGEVDLPRETQNLKVRVQPAIGESLSVGAVLLAHPAVGAISYLVQKLLRDPIDQVFAYQYAITGTWDDPKVNKLSAPTARDSTKAERE